MLVSNQPDQALGLSYLALANPCAPPSRASTYAFRIGLLWVVKFVFNYGELCSAQSVSKWIFGHVHHVYIFSSDRICE